MELNNPDSDLNRISALEHEIAGLLCSIRFQVGSFLEEQSDPDAASDIRVASEGIEAGVSELAAIAKKLCSERRTCESGQHL